MRVHLNTWTLPFCMVTLALSFAGVGQAKADFISAVASITGPGGSGSAAAVTFPPTAPNNDGVGAGNPNVITYTKTFTALQPIDIVLNVAMSAGTTEYLFNATIINNTGLHWLDFHFELGFGGFGTAFPFVRSGAGDGLDFDTPPPVGDDRNPTPTVTPAFFTTIIHGEDTLDIFGGPGVPPGAAVLFTYSVDVPPGVTALNPNGQNNFTIRQLPTVPEPSSVALLTLGAIGLIGYCWRRQKRALPIQKGC